MAHGQRDHEHPVQHQRRQRGESELGRRELRTRRLVVNFGSTLSVAKVATVAGAAPLPSALNRVIPYRTAPSSKQRPTIPLV